MSVFVAKKYTVMPFILSVVLVTIQFLCFYSASEAATIVPSRQTDYLRESIQLLAQARDNSIEDYNRAQQQGILDPTGQRDYQLFIAYLDSRIQSYCRELYELSGSTVMYDLPCSSSMGNGEAGNEIPMLPSPTADTTDEQITALDQSLTTALGEFDDMLLKEQENIATHLPSKRAGGYDSPSGGDTEGGSGEQKGESGRDDSQQGDTAEESSSQYEKSAESQDDSQQAEGAGNGSQETARESSSQYDHLDTSDDDIVARQLREAAEKETDPEVKKKLWEEYRKYKEGTR